MKKHPIASLILSLLTLFAAASVNAQVQSLRGDEVETASIKPEIKKYKKDDAPLARDYLQQPPLIPHKIDNYIVNLKHNKCLSCHSWKNYRQHRATKVSQTHFASRDGAVLSNISARRYFCLQCHVPQANAQPLVENTFQPVESMKLQ